MQPNDRSPLAYGAPKLTDGQRDQIVDLFKVALGRAKLSKSGAQRVIIQGNALLDATVDAVQKLAFPVYSTSTPFRLSIDHSISCQELWGKLETTPWGGRYSGWTIWEPTQDMIKAFLARQRSGGPSQGMYSFVQFNESISYQQAVSILNQDGVVPADFRELLEAMVAYDQHKIEIPMESSGGNTRANMFSLAEGHVEAMHADTVFWVAGAQISYHDVDSWKIIMAKSWKELMRPDWRGNWHVLVRLAGSVIALL